MTQSRSLEEIVPIGAAPIKLNHEQSFEFTEGPAWDGKGNLYFSDIPASRTYRIDSQGNFTPFREGTNRGNGMMFNHTGNLLTCEGGAHRVAEVDASGRVVRVLAESYKGKAINSPNDIVVDRKGGVYFTAPSSGKPGQDPPGVYYVTAGRELVRVWEGGILPNGIILSPDEKTLYVSDTCDKYLWALELRPDGSVGQVWQWGELEIAEPPTLSGKEVREALCRDHANASIADGMAVDVEGNLYVTTELGVQVLDSKGRNLGIISVPEQPANCAFGGDDMRNLYITARSSLYRIGLRVPGVYFPQKG